MGCVGPEWSTRPWKPPKGSLAFILRVCGAAVQGHRGEYWPDCSRNFCLAAVWEGDRRGARVDLGR